MNRTCRVCGAPCTGKECMACYKANHRGSLSRSKNQRNYMKRVGVKEI